MSFGSKDNGGSRSFGLRKGSNLRSLRRTKTLVSGQEKSELALPWRTETHWVLTVISMLQKNVDLRIKKCRDCKRLARQLHITEDFTFRRKCYT